MSEELKKILNNLLEAKSSGKPFETIYRSGPDKEIYYTCNYQRIRDNIYVVLSRDSTEQINLRQQLEAKNQQLEEALAVKSSFFSP